MKEFIQNLRENIIDLFDCSKVFIILMIIIIVSFIIVYNLSAYRDIETLKLQAPEFIEDRGFIITSYDGYEGSLHHGGFVWYQARDNNGFLYQMCVGNWRGENMMYNLKCLNAVSNDE